MWRTRRVGNQLVINIQARVQHLVERGGYRIWEVSETVRECDPARTALVLCDVWDRHTCRGAEERLARLLPGIALVVERFRNAGALIVHAPSDTIDFYEGMPARERVKTVSGSVDASPPADHPHEVPPLPIDPTDPCDTCPDSDHPEHRTGMPYPWTRQHAAIEIDQERDVVSADGTELWKYYSARGIDQVIIAGVHTNMCILNRTFAIKQLVRWGFSPILLRDLTDCMYSPEKSPYVSHEEATGLVVGYIEKFWCATASSVHLSTE